MSEEDTSKRERDETDELLLVQEGIDPSAKRLKTDFDDSSINHGSVVDIVDAQSTPIISDAIIEPEKLVDITAEQLVNKEQCNALQKETLATQATCSAQPETLQTDLKPATPANCCRTDEEISGVELSHVPTVSSVDPVGNSAFTLPYVEPNVPKPVNPSVAATALSSTIFAFTYEFIKRTASLPDDMPDLG